MATNLKSIIANLTDIPQTIAVPDLLRINCMSVLMSGITGTRSEELIIQAAEFTLNDRILNPSHEPFNILLVRALVLIANNKTTRRVAGSQHSVQAPERTLASHESKLTLLELLNTIIDTPEKILLKELMHKPSFEDHLKTHGIDNTIALSNSSETTPVSSGNDLIKNEMTHIPPKTALPCQSKFSELSTIKMNILKISPTWHPEIALFATRSAVTRAVLRVCKRLELLADHPFLTSYPDQYNQSMEKIERFTVNSSDGASIDEELRFTTTIQELRDEPQKADILRFLDDLPDATGMDEPS